MRVSTTANDGMTRSRFWLRQAFLALCSLAPQNTEKRKSSFRSSLSLRIVTSRYGLRSKSLQSGSPKLESFSMYPPTVGISAPSRGMTGRRTALRRTTGRAPSSSSTRQTGFPPASRPVEHADREVSLPVERQLGLFQGAGQLECRPLQLPTRRTMPAAAASAT